MTVLSCLLLACMGVSWFAYQYFLLSQPQSFAPDWGSARWIQAGDGYAPVVYFRSSPYLESVPSTASLTIGATDAFRLFVNSTLVGSNEADYVGGDGRRTYVFDITSELQQGPNGIVIRATDPDNHVPAIKVNIHYVIGSASYDNGSNITWKATGNSSLVYPRYARSGITTETQSVSQTTGPSLTSIAAADQTMQQNAAANGPANGNNQNAPPGMVQNPASAVASQSTIPTSAATAPRSTPLTPWSAANYDVTAWPGARIAAIAMPLYDMPVTPLIYNHSLPNHWMSAGAQKQGYFVRQISLSVPVKNYWIRFRASGPSNIFLNGNLLVNWVGESANSLQSVFGSFSYVNPDIKTRPRFSVGVYDIAPYLHLGTNTIAAYVSSPNATGFIGNTGAAMSMDMLVCDFLGGTTWNEESATWHASPQFASGWEQGNAAALAWPAPSFVPSSIAFQQFAVPGSNTILSGSNSLLSTIMIPWSLIGAVIGGSVLAVLGLWLLMSLTLGKRYYAPWPRARAVMSLAFLPALAYEALLITIGREPHLKQPFLYNTKNALALLALVLAGYFLLWLHAVLRSSNADLKVKYALQRFPGSAISTSLAGIANNVGGSGRWSAFLAWLGRYWVVILLMVIGSVLIIPTLSYEPLWQDELVSFYVAKNSVLRGFPMMPSGFIYPKAELFHYMLGIIMLIFGDQMPVPRSLSMIEYVASIPLLYGIGSYFFGRRIGLFAAAMLTLSPFALMWGAQLRMYEQAQVVVLIMLYVFHKAALAPKSKRMPYIAIASLVVTYLSHEETFIVMPALVLCVFILTKEKDRLLPSVFYQKHWWYASLIGIAIIALQLTIVKLSHPPILGTDQSMRPNVQFHEDSLPFYTRLLFFAKSTSPWLTLNSLLALVGCIWAIRSKDAHLRYCALFFSVSLGTLIALFTMQADRYFYPLLTIYLLLGSYVVWKTLEYLWRFAHTQFLSTGKNANEERLAQLSQLSLPIRIVSMLITCIVLGCILLAPMLPINAYNLTVSRVFGLSYYHHFADYDAAGAYIQKHWREGDIVFSVSSDIEMYCHVVRSDYFFSVDRALFLIERNGRAINTATASVALLSQTDLRTLVSKNARVWLVTDHGSYQSEATKHFTIPPEFHIVFEGARDAVFLRGS
ncbi:MAG: hypothetical protein NVS4B9_02820 [Ktedonobacteraceae bacterium]